MGLRLRYLDWSVGATAFDVVAAAIMGDTYDDARGHGFLVEHRSHEELRGRFVRRRKIVDTVTSPAGEIQTFERLEFDYSDFALRPGHAGVCLTNPPRGATELQMRLSSLSAHMLTISPVQLDLARVKLGLESRLGVRATIRSVRITDVRLEGASSAQVTVRGGDSALSGAQALVAPRPYKLERLELRLEVDGRSLGVMVTASGSVVLGARSAPTVLKAIWNAVLDGTESTSSLS